MAYFPLVVLLFGGRVIAVDGARVYLLPRAVGDALVLAVLALASLTMLTVSGWLFRLEGLLPTGGVVLATIGFSLWTWRRLGGVTGHVMGAVAVELLELTALLLVLALSP